MKKFVVVDDDPDDIDLFREAVEEASPSYQFYSAKNGKDLLAQLASGVIEEPYVVFLDVNMPEMNGWECLTNLKGNTKYRHIPVLMYSTSSAMRDAAKAVELGALGFYEKPPSFILLKDFLSQLATNEVIDKQSILDLVKSQSKGNKLYV